MTDVSTDAPRHEIAFFAGEDDAALEAQLRKTALFLDQAPDAALKDVAFTCSAIYDETPAKNAVAALVVATPAELRSRALALADRLKDGCSRVRDRSGTYYCKTHLLDGTGRLAFVFPGAAAFYPDMLRDVAMFSNVCRNAFDELEEALAGKGAFLPSSFVFPPAACYRHDADVFSAGGYAEAMVSTYSANAAFLRFFRDLGVEPDAVVGFSGGDLNALDAAGTMGALKRGERLDFLRDVYHVVNTCVRHEGLPRCVMTGVFAAQPAVLDETLALLDADRARVSFRQSPRQATIAVRPDALDYAYELFAAHGLRTMRLSVDRPFNTGWCEKVLPVFRKFASRWVRYDAKIPIYACDRAAAPGLKTRKVRDAAAALWCAPVRFADTIRTMHAEGCRVFLEAGPRGMATNAVGEVLKGETFAALPANSIHRSGTLQLLHAVARLAALGAPVKPAALFASRRVRRLDFDAPLFLEVRAERELKLQREFPRLTLVVPEMERAPAVFENAAGAGGKARARQAAAAARERRARRFDYGFAQPLVAGSLPVKTPGGASVERRVTLDEATAPFLGDYALGAQGLSYSDKRLRGYTPLSLFVGAELMAETAQDLVPSMRLVSIDDLQSRRTVAFANGRLPLVVRAERVLGDDPSLSTVRAELRMDAPDAEMTTCIMEATLTFSRDRTPKPVAFTPPALSAPRDVHWTESDVYPDRLVAGESLRGIRSADRWSGGGLDYEVEVPSPARAVAHTRFPAWVINPPLLAAVSDGFSLWRSHERFQGAFSLPFRLRRFVLHVPSLVEGQRLKCYLRLVDATERSHVVDVLVSDGNGNLVMELRGYERLAERVEPAYLQLILSPSAAFLTHELPADVLGAPATPVASAAITAVPYGFFEANEELWLKIVSRIVLGKGERGPFREMSGSPARRTEWLFGRIAAKEAVRRFLAQNYQARWSGADVQIWADDSGKPHALGAWRDFLASKLDLAIAHTKEFVVALVAANARAGVDVEDETRDLTDEFARGVFGADELGLIASTPNAPATAIRFWCAKEAVSKALGTGIRFPPKELTVSNYLPESGEIVVALEGQWLEAFKQFRGRTVSVHVATVKGHVLASCFLPETLFA